jgi:hypothetical protein
MAVGTWRAGGMSLGRSIWTDHPVQDIRDRSAETGQLVQVVRTGSPGRSV